MHGKINFSSYRTRTGNMSMKRSGNTDFTKEPKFLYKIYYILNQDMIIILKINFLRKLGIEPNLPAHEAGVRDQNTFSP